MNILVNTYVKSSKVSIDLDIKDNLISSWQSKGKHYVSYDNLIHLNDLLTSFNQNRTKQEKSQLLNELIITYFARFHNIIRIEYLHEKNIIENRIKTWSLKKLIKEGYTLIDLYAKPKGKLFQDKVYRLTPSDNNKFGYHRFTSGDIIRLSDKYGNYFDGMVLEKRNKFIDITVPASTNLDLTNNFRIDLFFNRISYERSLKGLELFLEPSDGIIPISRCLRDLIMYSYPNSLIMLAQSPGGLKLALPDLSIFNKQNSNRETISMYTNITNINDHTSVKAQLDQTIQFDSRVYPSVLTKPDISSYLPSDTSTAITSGGKVITVSDALNKLSFTKSNSNEIIKSSMEIIETAIKPVFLTNSRLREMTEHLTSERITGYYPVTKEEICHCIERVLIKLNTTINISQSEALIGALSRPLSLIQGPPGTGKTRTAGLILTTLIEIYNTRMKQGGFLAKGIKVNRILACAHSNLASDNILEQLILANIKVVRIGRPVNIHTSLWNYTLDCLLDNEYEYKIAKQNLNLAFKFLSETVPELTDGKSITQLKKDIATYKKELAEVEQACVYRILNDADVIVSTCIGAGSDILRDFVETYGLRFSTVLIDEACQSAESNLFPTLVYGCERLILVGDQNQLPPFVSSPLALEQGLGISLFARLISGGLEPYLLTEQYRMHPDIANFSSTEFYSGKVKTAIAKEDRPIPRGFNWPNMNIPVAFIDICPKSVTRNNPDKLIYSDLFEHINDDSQDIEEELNQIYKSNKRINRPKRSDGLSSGFELQSKASNSYCNLAEAQVVIKIIRQLISVSDISLSDIGVISPYNGQVREVTKRCREIGWTVDASTDVNIVSNFKDNSIIKPDKPPKQEFNDTNNKVENIWSDISSRKVSADLESDEDTTLSLDNNLDSYLVTSEDTYNSTSQIFNQLEIKSIDGYQGREKEVIILTAVRSNPNKSLGFLSDWRRLNVAVTRGKRGLIVIGDSTTLSNDIHWGNFIDWCRSNSCYKLDNEMLNISELRQQIIDYKNNS